MIFLYTKSKFSLKIGLLSHIFEKNETDR